MTRWTYLRIQNDPEVHGTAYGPVKGKYGVYIGSYGESPSGCKRPDVLLTSEPLFETAEQATEEAQNVIRQVRSGFEVAAI